MDEMIQMNPEVGYYSPAKKRGRKPSSAVAARKNKDVRIKQAQALGLPIPNELVSYYNKRKTKARKQAQMRRDAKYLEKYVTNPTYYDDLERMKAARKKTAQQRAKIRKTKKQGFPLTESLIIIDQDDRNARKAARMQKQFQEEEETPGLKQYRQQRRRDAQLAKQYKDVGRLLGRQYILPYDKRLKGIINRDPEHPSKAKTSRKQQGQGIRKYLRQPRADLGSMASLVSYARRKRGDAQRRYIEKKRRTNPEFTLRVPKTASQKAADRKQRREAKKAAEALMLAALNNPNNAIFAMPANEGEMFITELQRAMNAGVPLNPDQIAYLEALSAKQMGQMGQ